MRSSPYRALSRPWRPIFPLSESSAEKCSRREWNLERNGVDEIHPPRRRVSEQITRLLILRQNYSLQNAFSNKAIETLTELVH